jgi:hypothetical protein
MTAVTVDRALLELAIEALNRYTTPGLFGGRVPIDADVVAQLRAAIIKKLTGEMPEPVGAVYTLSGVSHCTMTKALNDTELYTANQLREYAAGLVAKRDAEIAELTDVMAFIERWANHHAPKPHMDAEQALSVIQHHPSIKAITKQYSDGKVPETHDPYAEIGALKAEVERLTADARRYQWLR